MPTMTECKNVPVADWCPVCAEHGRQSRLTFYQVNLDDAVVICSHKGCVYPLGKNAVSSLLVKRKASDIANLRRRKGNSCSGGLSSCSSSRSASPLTLGHISSPPLSMPLLRSRIQRESNETVFDEKSMLNKPVCDNLNSINTNCELPLKKPKLEQLPSSTATSPLSQSKKIENNCDTPSVLEPCNAQKMDSVLSLGQGTNQREVPIQFIQWKNRYALCWLDVVLCLLIHCSRLYRLFGTQVCDKKIGVDSIKHDKDNIIRKLLSSYHQALQLVNRKPVYVKAAQVNKIVKLETSVGTVAVKTGGGDVKSNVFNLMTLTAGNDTCSPKPAADNELESCIDSFFTPKMVSTKFDDSTPHYDPGSGNLSSAAQILEDIREEVWQVLYPKLRCQKGLNDSPVFALPLVLRHAGSTVEDLFRVKYTWFMTCSCCGDRHTDRVEKTLPTFPGVPADFSMGSRPYFLRDCFQCRSHHQRMQMRVDSYPPVFVVHFVEGLPEPCSDLQVGTFQMEEHRYHISGVVQYKNNPDHFVAWIRDPVGGMWMECDDLKDPLCRFSATMPTFTPAQVHMVMWEREGDSLQCISSKLCPLPHDSNQARYDTVEISSMSDNSEDEKSGNKHINLQPIGPKLTPNSFKGQLNLESIVESQSQFINPSSVLSHAITPPFPCSVTGSSSKPRVFVPVITALSPVNTNSLEGARLEACGSKYLESLTSYPGSGMPLTSAISGVPKKVPVVKSSSVRHSSTFTQVQPLPGQDQILNASTQRTECHKRNSSKNTRLSMLRTMKSMKKTQDQDDRLKKICDNLAAIKARKGNMLPVSNSGQSGLSKSYSVRTSDTASLDEATSKVAMPAVAKPFMTALQSFLKFPKCSTASYSKDAKRDKVFAGYKAQGPAMNSKDHEKGTDNSNSSEISKSIIQTLVTQKSKHETSKKPVENEMYFSKAGQVKAKIFGTEEIQQLHGKRANFVQGSEKVVPEIRPKRKWVDITPPVILAKKKKVPTATLR